MGTNEYTPFSRTFSSNIVNAELTTILKYMKKNRNTRNKELTRTKNRKKQ